MTYAIRVLNNLFNDVVLAPDVYVTDQNVEADCSSPETTNLKETERMRRCGCLHTERMTYVPLMGTSMYADVLMCLKLVHDSMIHLATTIDANFEVDVPAHAWSTECNELKTPHEDVGDVERVEEIMHENAGVNNTLAFSRTILVHDCQQSRMIIYEKQRMKVALKGTATMRRSSRVAKQRSREQ